jgi:hypothetical protein
MELLGGEWENPRLFCLDIGGTRFALTHTHLNTQTTLYIKI